jgi:hypothetical protein
MLEKGTYRDGGTLYFKHPLIKNMTKSDIDEVCLDLRMSTNEEDIEWYLGYPDKGRLLTEKEKETIIPWITQKLNENLKVLEYQLKEIKKHS